MNILWLASWYPSRVNFLAGDFIERHAKAASLFDNIVLIHVVKDRNIKNGKTHVDKIEYSKTFTALICYYPAFNKWGRFNENIVSAFYYLHLHFQVYSGYKKIYGKPDCTLVQVAIKAGIIAYIWKIIFGNSYIVFERWTGLLQQARPNFSDLNIIYQWLWKLILKNAIKIVTVTRNYGQAIAGLYFTGKENVVIPNTFIAEYFYPVKDKTTFPFRLIHVSTLDYQKNFEDILYAMQLVRKQNIQIEMVVYGNPTKELISLTEQLNLEDIVYYKGEVNHEEIAKAMQQSHALVLYSRYESFGNVLIEANACGLPVIVSDLPVFHEIIKDGVTGIFAQNASPNDLAEKMIWLIKNYNRFDPQLIHDHVKQQYNSSAIGKKFHDLFQSSFNVPD